MARHWHETYDSARHADHMHVAGPLTRTEPYEKLLPRTVYFVAVAGFTFEFHSLDQIQTAIDYFSQKVRPSSLLPREVINGNDCWEVQRWYDRIPMTLLKEPRRLRVVKALTDTLTDFGRESPASSR